MRINADRGIKTVFKRLKCNLENPGGTLYLDVRLSGIYMNEYIYIYEFIIVLVKGILFGNI